MHEAKQAMVMMMPQGDLTFIDEQSGLVRAPCHKTTETAVAKTRRSATRATATRKCPQLFAPEEQQ
jgi:hypothetical protein